MERDDVDLKFEEIYSNIKNLHESHNELLMPQKPGPSLCNKFLIYFCSCCFFLYT